MSYYRATNVLSNRWISAAFAARRGVGWVALPSIAAIAMLLMARAPAVGCDTPVYRYALYSWEPSPYRVYYLYRGEAPADQGAIHEAWSKLKSAAAPANVEFHAVNVDATKADGNKSAPPEAAELAEEYADETPKYVVMNPHRLEVFAGQLTADDAAAFVRSPVRDQIHAQLAAGKAGVVVLMTGDKDEANRAAEKAIQANIRAAAAGEIVPAKPPEDGERLGRKEDSKSEGDEKPPAAAPSNKFDVGYVRLDRSDARERWLVRCLLNVEEEFAEETEPLVFIVYGRGRVSPPCVGNEIGLQELPRLVAFVLGPCACTVKRDNPGGDLPVAYDWQSAAAAMAKRHGPETGNEQLLGGEGFPNLFPQIIEAPPVESPAKLPPKSDDSTVKPDAGSPSATQDKRPANEASETPADTGAGESLRVDSPRGDSPSQPRSASGDPRSSVTLPATTMVGFGILVGVLCLALATLALVRRSG